jgi:CDP-diacylglycerol--glycerol-3-phosphate 3-phosphatidyltransferase
MAQGLARRGTRPVQVTLWAAAMGVLAAGSLAVGWTLLFLLLLWASGILDAVDGTLARLSGSASRGGALFDIVCDRVVEVLVILAFGLRFPDARLELLVLCGAIILSLTVFLTAAAALPGSTDKSFHYQAGLTERTEGFLFFSLMAVWPQRTGEVAAVFALAVTFTAVQRFRAVLRFLRD